MKYASIDIGSNTILLLVAQAEEDGRLKTLCEKQRTPRLGKGVDSSGNLHPDSMDRAVQALTYYRNVLEDHYPEVESIIVTATSAVRDAANRASFLKRIKKETAFEVQLLSGSEEAAYTYAGALSTLSKQEGPVAVLDIGGGSTEFAVGSGDELKELHSFDMGSVRFTERFLKGRKPSLQEVEACKHAVQALLTDRALKLSPHTKLVGAAGTLTSLACLDLGLQHYNAGRVNEYFLAKKRVEWWIHTIAEWGSERLLANYPEVMKGRADVLLAGILILDELMEYYRFPEVTVSVGGIRHGSIIMQQKKGAR